MFRGHFWPGLGGGNKGYQDWTWLSVHKHTLLSDCHSPRIILKNTLIYWVYHRWSQLGNAGLLALFAILDLRVHSSNSCFFFFFCLFLALWECFYFMQTLTIVHIHTYIQTSTCTHIPCNLRVHLSSITEVWLPVCEPNFTEFHLLLECTSCFPFCLRSHS